MSKTLSNAEMANLLKFGDVVTAELDGRILPDLVVIGIPTYSKDNTVVMLAKEEKMGMPVHHSWCEKTGEDLTNASLWVQRFLIRYPASLKPAGRTK